MSGNVTLAGNTRITAINAEATISGIIGDGGNDYGFEKTGNGTLTLSKANTYTGATTVSAGTLALSGAGSVADSNGVSVASGAIFDISGVTASTTVKELSGTGFVTLGAKNLIVGSGNTSTTFSGVISGAGGSLTKTGSGTLTLSGANTYGGGTTINGGTVAVSRDANLGASSGAVTINAGTLRATDTFETNRDVMLGDAASTVEVDDAKILTLNGSMTGSGTLNKTGLGTLKNLGGFTGTVDITAGTVEVSTATFGNVLTGTGTLAANLATSATELTFGNAVGIGFGGTVRMMQGTISLDDTANLTVLQNAALQLDANSSTTITQNHSIKGLTMNGGTLKFDVTSITPDGVLTVTNLNTSNGGTVMMDLNKPIDTTAPAAQNLYDYSADVSTMQQKLVGATHVTGGGTALAWKDYNGADLASSQTRDLMEGATNTGVATFDYMASVKNDTTATGIYLGYGLTQIESLTGQSVTFIALLTKN